MTDSTNTIDLCAKSGMITFDCTAPLAQWRAFIEVKIAEHECAREERRQPTYRLDSLQRFANAQHACEIPHSLYQSFAECHRQ